MTPHHLESKDLLLLQSGDLSSDEAGRMKEHLRSCTQCQQRFAELEEVFGALSEASSAAAIWSFRIARQERERPLWRRALSRRNVTTGLAATMTVVLAVVSVTSLAPRLRAESLLTKAIAQEQKRGEAHSALRISSGARECKSGTDLVAASGDGSFCSKVADQFRGAGWNWKESLSPKNFRNWRAALGSKTDSVHERDGAVEITTETEESTLRQATLRLRKSDYHSVSGHFEFVFPGGELSKVEVTTLPETYPEGHSVAVNPPVPPGVPAGNRPLPKVPIEDAFIDPALETEARVRIALHMLDLDRDPLVAVRRIGDETEVWGVAPSLPSRDRLKETLTDVSGVRLSLGSDAGQGVRSLPWEPYRGEGLPLAYEQINALFPNDPNGRQNFLNTIDTVTRRIVGQTRTAEEIKLLIAKLGNTRYRSRLQDIGVELTLRLEADLTKLATLLEPLLGSTAPTAKRLPAARARDLYLVVHEIAFLGRPGAERSLEDAIAEARTLLRPADRVDR